MPPEQNTPTPPTTADTNNGFLVGVDPQEPPRTAAQWADVQAETMAGNGPSLTSQAPVEEAPPGQRYYTEEDVERVRREEKDKLYGRIETMSEQLKVIQQEREEREAALRSEQEAEAESRRREEEEKMEVRELLAKKEEEWTARLSEVEQRYDQDRAVFEKEQRFNEVQAYRQARIEQEAEYIIPELRDLVIGDSEDTIDASIEMMKERTAAIMGNIQQGVSQERQTMRGAAPTAPPVGPMEQMTTYESLTPEDIRDMDMETYKKHRATLLGATGRSYRGY